MLLTLGPPQLRTEFEFTVPQFKTARAHRVLARKTNWEIDSIGIWMSGGLDSAALLALILSDLAATDRLHMYPLHCFYVYTCGHRIEGPAKKVSDYFSEKFSVPIDFHRYIDPVEAGASIAPSTYKRISYTHKNMLFYQGLNNPPTSDVVELPLTWQGYPRLQETGTIYDSPYRFPFLNLHKPQILDILYQLACDGVIPLTQSCIRAKFLGDQCGACFSCHERSWGFEMLGKTDPGLAS